MCVGRDVHTKKKNSFPLNVHLSSYCLSIMAPRKVEDSAHQSDQSDTTSSTPISGSQVSNEAVELAIVNFDFDGITISELLNYFSQYSWQPIIIDSVGGPLTIPQSSDEAQRLRPSSSELDLLR